MCCVTEHACFADASVKTRTGVQACLGLQASHTAGSVCAAAHRRTCNTEVQCNGQMCERERLRTRAFGAPAPPSSLRPYRVLPMTCRVWIISVAACTSTLTSASALSCEVLTISASSTGASAGARCSGRSHHTCPVRIIPAQNRLNVRLLAQAQFQKTSACAHHAMTTLWPSSVMCFFAGE